MTSQLRIASLVSLGLLSLAGCPEKANPDADGLDCEGEICRGSIAIITPAQTAYTNRTVTIRIAAMPADNPPAQIQLLKDGAEWKLLAPPFEYAWDTAKDPEPEGAHQIVASADINGRKLMSEPVTIVVDRTPPRIESQPAPAASNVALSDPIRVTFSEPVDAATTPKTALTLTDSTGTDLAATSSLSADGKTLTVTSWNRTAFILPQTITESIAPTITDRAGNALATTPAWSWTAPQWVKLPRLSGRSPSLGVDSAGQPTISYVKPDPANPTAQTWWSGPLGVARYAVGSAWDPTFTPPSNAYVYSHALALDRAGAAVVAWPDGNSVGVAREVGGSWQTIGPDPSAGLAALPKGISSMALDAAGNPTVGIWVFQVGYPPGIPPTGYLMSWTGSAWMPATSQGFAGYGGAPIIRLDSTGQPFVMGYQGITRLMGGMWVSASPSPIAVFGSFAVDAQDRAVVAYPTTSGTTTTLDVRAWNQTAWQIFGPPVASATVPFHEVQVVLAPDGNPVIAWMEYLGTAPTDLHVARFDGQSWRTQYELVNAVSGSSPAHVQLAVDRRGSPTVAFDEYDPATGTTSVYVWKSNR